MLTIFDRIKKVLIEVSEAEEENITPEASFRNDLNLDSLGQLELIMALEEEFAFEIDDHEARDLTTVSKAVNFITGKMGR